MPPPTPTPPSRPPSSPPPRRRPATHRVTRRRRGGALIGGTLLAALLALLAVALFWRSSGGNPAPTAPPPAAPVEPAAMPDGWGAFLHDNARLGASSTDMGPPGALRPVWSFVAPAPLFNPVRAGDVLLVLSADGILYALDPAAGAQRWAFNLGALYPTGADQFVAPAVDEEHGAVIVGTRGALWALDAATGAVRWRFTGAGAFGGAPLVADGLVVACTAGGQLTALDAAGGTARWSATVDPPGGAAPSLAEGIVVVPTSTGRVFAFDLADGSPRWSVATARGPARTAAIARGLVFVPAGDGALLALDLRTGAERWRYDTGIAAPVLPPAIAREAGVLVFGIAGAGLVALDPADGTLAWRSADVLLDPGGGAVIADERVYVAAAREIVVLDLRTGTARGRIGAEAPLAGGLMVADGLLLRATTDGVLTAFGAGAGRGEPAVNRAVSPPTPTPAGEPTIFVGPAGARPTARPTPVATSDSPRVE